MKWLFENLRARGAFALKNPRYAANPILRELVRADQKFIGRITGESPERIRGYLSEPISMPGFAELVSDAEHKFRGLAVESADLFARACNEPDARIIRGVGFLRKTDK